MFDSLVFYDASLDISCEKGETDFEDAEEEEVVSFLRHMPQSCELGCSKCLICIFIYFMTILLRLYCWW